MANILLKVMGDGTDAKKTLDETSAEVDRFGKKQATAQIKVDAAQAKRDIAEVVAEAKLIPREETIRIRVAGEQAKLEELTTRLKALEQQLTSTAEAGGATDPLIQRMGSVSRQIDATRLRIEALGSDFRKVSSDGESASLRLFNSVKKVDSGIGDLLGHVPLLGGLMSGVFNGVSSALNGLVQMLPEAAQGFASILATGLSLAAVAPVVLLIVGALSALIVSLGLALIGVVALGVAFLAALAPIALIVGAVIVKLKDAATAQANLTAATTAQKQAVQALHTAQQNESTQRIAALQAEKDAVLQLHDAEDQLADAKLNVQGTALAIQQAKLALQQFLQGSGLTPGATPGSLVQRAGNVDVHGNFGQTQSGASATGTQAQMLQYRQLVLSIAEAEQQHKDAIDNVADSLNNLNAKQATANDFAKHGLKAYQPFRTALDQAATAMRNLHTANLKVGADTKAMAGSDGILGVFDKLKRTLSVILGPAVQAAFTGLGHAFGILAGGLKPLEPALKLLGTAVGAGFVQWAKAITDPKTLGGLKTLIEGSAKLIGPLVTLFDNFMSVLLIVVNASMPTLIQLVQNLGTWFANVAKHPQDIKKFILECISQTRAWWNGIKDLLATMVKLANVFEKIVNAIKTLAKLTGASFGAAARTATFTGGGGGASSASIQQAEQIANDPHVPASTRQLWREALHKMGVKGYAAGGITVGTSFGMIGEAGPEAILPLTPQTFQNLGERIAQAMFRNFPSPRFPIAGASPAAATGWTGDMHNHFGSAPIDPDHFAAVTQRRIMRAIHGLGGGVG